MPKTIDQKREEAEERKLAYEKRTPAEQLALIEHRPGNSTEERYKLLAKLEADNGQS